MEHTQYEKQAALVELFDLKGTLVEIKEFGNGHINTTFLVKLDVDGEIKSYVLQLINTDIFKNPDELMHNIMGVTSFLRKKIEENGGDPTRETLNVIKTRDGKGYCKDDEGKCYRMYDFIKNTVSYDSVTCPEDFYASAEAFGNFQYMLADYPAETLYETIPNFHNTGKRYKDFCAALEADVCGRAASVAEEIAFVKDRAEQMTWLTDRLAKNELPLRVTHNDTKLNNIMMDKDTGKAVCVVDLDTVMPGLSLYDFGDAIRFGASTGAEDETDLSKIWMDLGLYEQYVIGYLKGCKGSLTELEVEMFPEGAKMMTLECGMRFLADYLSGDTYFKIHREHHNLDRARTQFKLVKDMEDKWDEMKAIVRKAKG